MFISEKVPEHGGKEGPFYTPDLSVINCAISLAKLLYGLIIKIKINISYKLYNSYVSCYQEVQYWMRMM